MKPSVRISPTVRVLSTGAAAFIRYSQASRFQLEVRPPEAHHATPGSLPPARSPQREAWTLGQALLCGPPGRKGTRIGQMTPGIQEYTCLTSAGAETLSCFHHIGPIWESSAKNILEK